MKYGPDASHYGQSGGLDHSGDGMSHHSMKNVDVALDSGWMEAPPDNPTGMVKVDKGGPGGGPGERGNKQSPQTEPVALHDNPKHSY